MEGSFRRLASQPLFCIDTKKTPVKLPAMARPYNMSEAARKARSVMTPKKYHAARENMAKARAEARRLLLLGKHYARLEA